MFTAEALPLRRTWQSDRRIGVHRATDRKLISLRILQVARNGATGETYAFNADGLMISESRFDDQLKQVGLLADLPGSQSVLTVELRAPGVDVTAGESRPA